jgi:hypothetical protein
LPQSQLLEVAMLAKFQLFCGFELIKFGLENDIVCSDFYGFSIPVKALQSSRFLFC